MSRSISYLKNLQGCRSMSKIVGLTTLQQIYVRQEANCNWYYIVIVTVGRWHCLHRGRFIWEDRAGCRDKITLFSPNGQTDENNCQFQNTYMLAAPAELNKVYSSMVLCCLIGGWFRSEEHTSELQSRPHISYAVFCLKKKKKQHTPPPPPPITLQLCLT